jgi:hypothetical protein
MSARPTSEGTQWRIGLLSMGIDGLRVGMEAE